MDTFLIIGKTFSINQAFLVGFVEMNDFESIQSISKGLQRKTEGLQTKSEEMYSFRGIRVHMQSKAKVTEQETMKLVEYNPSISISIES